MCEGVRNMSQTSSSYLVELVSPAIAELRTELIRARCAFQFNVFQVEPYRYSEDLHKAALAMAFQEIDIKADIQSAKSKTLLAGEFDALVTTRGLPEIHPPLFHAFRDPPYGTSWTDSDAQENFVKWLKLLGADRTNNLCVLDWVGDPDQNPGRSGWSTYFDSGKEWWGIWCLTIWNPARNTISVLVASQTD